ncbi:hypothetical protein GCM10023168_06290 [Fodinibacter luteus]|uniref:Peptide subunit release factor 1 (ERF1) n=1 Tax=Fodinibacter luteus TaxID=552064 RepID=A0ABP8K1E0_9MICO
MTATAIDAAPRRAAPLPLPTAAEVLALQAVREYPAISVLCTTDTAPTMSTTAVARLEQLVDDATRRLRREFGGPVAASLRDDLLHLVDDVKERPTRAAVALYVSSRHVSAWGLPQPVIDRAVVDPTFATRDLVRSLHRTPRHVVLVLTEGEARLFDGTGDTLLPPFGGPFPLVDRTPRGRGRPQGRPARGHDEHRRTETFLRTVDRALGTYLSLHPAPLVLVGAGRTLTRFTRISTNLQRLAGSVQGSHARTPLPTLARLIRPVLEDYLRSREGEALALLDRRSRTGTVATGMPAVWLASRAERPEMLAVEEGLFYPARVSRDGDLITPAHDLEHPDVIDDAVDEVIETVLRRGGWVALVRDGALSATERIVLTVRPR